VLDIGTRQRRVLAAARSVVHERGWLASQWDPHIEAGTPARSRANGDGAPGGFDSFPDRDEAEAFPVHTFDLESHAIVGDRQDEFGLVTA
jgi:hypothetical protein